MMRIANDRYWRKWGGFTLLELLLVLAILALMVDLAPPLFSAALPGMQLRADARALAATLRLARNLAVTHQEETRLVLDLEHHSYHVDGSRRKQIIAPGLSVKLLTVGSEQVSPRKGAIRFYPDGGSTGGRIVLASARQTMAIEIDWLTGRVSLRPPRRVAP